MPCEFLRQNGIFHEGNMTIFPEFYRETVPGNRECVNPSALLPLARETPRCICD